MGVARLLAIAAVFAFGLAAGRRVPAAAPEASAEIGALLDRLGARVQQYYSRARSIVCIETVRLQPLGPSFGAEGFARVLVYDLRVTWEPSEDPSKIPEPAIVRELRSVNGRPPKPNFEPGCTDPPSVASDPLALLLPGEREKYAFNLAGSGRDNKRPAVLLDYRARAAEPAEVKWKGDCVSISLPGRTRGRLWIDPDDDDVLRLDERLTGRFDVPVPPEKRGFGPSYMEIERVDTTTRYRAVTFDDPEETVMLPESVTTLTVISGAGVPRLRTTETYSDYKRFVTDARVLPD